MCHMPQLDWGLEVSELNQKIEDKRDVIEPLLTKVRPLRTKHQNLQNEMKEAKRKYDSELARIESGRGNLEREVAKIRKEHTQGTNPKSIVKNLLIFF